jgi:hypothetical protein
MTTSPIVPLIGYISVSARIEASRPGKKSLNEGKKRKKMRAIRCGISWAVQALSVRHPAWVIHSVCGENSSLPDHIIRIQVRGTATMMHEQSQDDNKA